MKKCIINNRLYQQIEYSFKNYLPIKQLYTEHNVEINSKMQFDNLPFICKNILSEYSFDKLFAVPITRISRIFTSTGTTGKKHYVAFTENDWKMQSNILARSFIQSGLTSDDVFYDCVPKSPVFGGHISYAAATQAGATVVPGGKMNTDEHLNMICTIKPTVLNGLSFFILKIGGLLPEDIRTKIKLIYVVGEYLYPLIREKIQQMYPNAEIFSGYGISEMCANNECRDHSGFHYNPEEYIVEVINQDSNGIGEIVFTSLFSEAMPLIRYKTGDKGRLIETGCCCGNEWPKIEVIGRLDQMINIKGKLIDKDELKKVIYSCEKVKFAHLKYYPMEDSRIELHYLGNADREELSEIIKQRFDITPVIFNNDSIEIEQWKTPFIEVIC